MGTHDERIAYLEGKVEEQSHTFTAIRDSLAALDRRIDRLEQRMDARFEAIDRRFETMDHRFTAIDDKMSRQFLWIVGIQITTLVAVVGAVLSRG